MFESLSESSPSYNSAGLYGFLSLLVSLSLSCSSSKVHASEQVPDSPIERAPIVLGQGEQRLLRIPGLIKYSLGGSAARILPLYEKNLGKGSKVAQKESLLIKGVSPGIVDPWVWKKDNRA